MLRSALSLLIGALLLTSTALAQVTIGHINLPNLAASDPEYAKIEKEISSLGQEYGQKLQPLMEKYQKLVAEFGSLSANGADEQQLEALAKEVQDAEASYQKQAEEYDKIIAEKRDELSSDLADKYEAAAKKVIKKHGLSGILRQQNNENVSFILHAPPSTDMSAAMKNQLDIPLNDYDQNIPAFDVDPKEVAIGFTNIELLMLSWPKARQAEAYLEEERQNMASDLIEMDEEFNELLAEYNTALQAKSDDLDDLREELVELDTDRKALAQKSDGKLAQLRGQIMGPLLQELQNAIDLVADKHGFTYVVNQTNSEGLSTILFGPNDADISQAVLAQLQVELTSPLVEPKAAKPAKIGYVNVDKVLADMKEVTAANEELQAFREEIYPGFAMKFEIKQSSLQDKESTLQRADITPSHRADLQVEIEEIQAEIVKLENEYATVVNEKEVELFTPILTKIQDAIDAEAEKGGYTVVINDTPGTVVLIGSGKQDLTSKISSAVQ